MVSIHGLDVAVEVTGAGKVMEETLGRKTSLSGFFSYLHREHEHEKNLPLDNVPPLLDDYPGRTPTRIPGWGIMGT